MAQPKVYVIRDTPLCGPSRKERRAALRREGSGEGFQRPDVPMRVPDAVWSLPREDTPTPVSRKRPSATPTPTPAPTPGLAGAASAPATPVPPLPFHAAPGDALSRRETEPRSSDLRRAARRLPRPAWNLTGAYLGGPLAAGRWSSGRKRTAWSAFGSASVAAAGLMLIAWSSFVSGVETVPHGAFLWLAAVTIVPISLFATWSHAIAGAAANHPAQLSGRLRKPWLAMVLGLLVPGAGYHVADRSRRAAGPFRWLGPFAAAAAILRHAEWLWAIDSAGETGAGDVLELVFVAAAVVAAGVPLAWIAHACRAARLVPSERRPPHSGRLAVLLLVTLALFFGTIAERPLAASLHSVTTSLRDSGLRLIPLGLAHVSARLDPARAIYLADVAGLNDSLGRHEAALEARRLLAERAEEFRFAVAAAGTTPHAPAPRSAPARTGSTWNRILALSR